MTEVTCSAITWDPSETSYSNAVGELMPNVEGMLVDEDEKEVAPLQRGELWVRAPNVMKGYWQKLEATRETLTRDRWLKTGDIAYLDENGKIFIVDRKKVGMVGHRLRHKLTARQELIKVKGNQVAPAELEALLLDHPAVADAAVVGVTMYVERLLLNHTNADNN